MKIRYRMFLIALVIIYLSLFPQNTANAATAPSISSVIIYDSSSEINSSEIILFSDKIKWRYKYINNVLYKRQYNYTKKKWIGDWIKV